MTYPSRDQYLESKVLTASQPQLHMMLLDGAIRFGRQAKEKWEADTDFDEVDQPLTRMFDIVEELLQGLASGEGVIAQQLEEQYAFIYRELAASRMNQDLARLNTCLDLLAYQRETWQLASQRIDTAETANIAPPKAAPTMPHLDMDTTPGSTAGFSFEA